MWRHSPSVLVGYMLGLLAGITYAGLRSPIVLLVPGVAAFALSFVRVPPPTNGEAE